MIMSVPYKLRRLQKKTDISVRNCYTQNIPPQTFNPKVCLERLQLLECRNNQNSRFYLKEGKIIIKPINSFLLKKYLFQIIFTLILLTAASIFWRDNLQSCGIAFVEKYANIRPTLQSFYSNAIKFHTNVLKQCKYNREEINKQDGKLISGKSDEDFTLTKNNSEIRQLVRNYVMEARKINKIQDVIKSSKSFIEEQCARHKKDSFNPVESNFYNTTLLELANLTDYALESQGAQIVTVYNTELYGVRKVKFFNLNIWPDLIHVVTEFLKYFRSNDPKSLLVPWKKPGDCWAFKGSYGRVEIKLSDDIVITAISIDHIPKQAVPNGSIQSAPKKFSVAGIIESKNQVNRIHLGSYEYKTTGPPTQTFFIQPPVEIVFRRIEVIIESNHGNENYTCIYKIRVHGHK